MERVAFLAAAVIEVQTESAIVSLAETAIEAVSGIQPEPATVSLAEAVIEAVSGIQAEAAVASLAEIVVVVEIASEVGPLAVALK